jgi:hypothetical protein
MTKEIRMPNSEGAGDACAWRAALGALAKSISQFILPCGELLASANFGGFPVFVILSAFVISASSFLFPYSRQLA